MLYKHHYYISTIENNLLVNKMKKILKIELTAYENYLIPKIYFFGLTHKFRKLKLVQTSVFPWEKVFRDYFSKNNIEQKVKNLKEGMDEISCEYVDHFIKLFDFIEKPCFKGIWTEYDKKLEKECKKFKKTFKQPFEKLLEINPFYYLQIYGLKDLNKNTLKNMDGKIIVDGGALNGDTAIMFHNYFPNSTIYAFEPIYEFYNIIEKILRQNNCNHKIIPVQKGLSDKQEQLKIKYVYTNTVQIDTVDNFFQDKNTIGLIKLDTEGFESLIIKGAENVIKKDKPVIVAAIYHTPEDFFELKDRIKALNPDYKFMIRRSELTLPQADLVLIAY